MNDFVLTQGNFLGTATHLLQEKKFALSITRYEKGDALADLPHYHEEPNLYFVLGGGSVENKNGKKTERFAGDLLFYHAGEKHQNIRRGKFAQSLNIEMAFSFLQENYISESVMETRIRKSPDAKFIMLRALRELTAADQYTVSSVELLLLELINSSLNQKAENRWPPWIKRLNELLHDNWDGMLNLRELAAATSVNPVTISRYFPRYFSCTLGEYMRKLKIEKSLSLIKNTSLPLTQIAFECGFSDQSHFIRTFKHFTGLLPRQFRYMK